jgi:hypothetical protein
MNNKYKNKKINKKYKIIDLHRSIKYAHTTTNQKGIALRSYGSSTISALIVSACPTPMHVLLAYHQVESRGEGGIRG